VRHGTREAARLAATNYGDVTAVAQEACARMDLVYAHATPKVTLTPKSADGTLGGLAQVEVEAGLTTLTGLLDGVFGGIDLHSVIEFRLEQPYEGEADWWNGGAGGAFTCT
jgi:hypothetical protein